jgi:hypothetical protein
MRASVGWYLQSQPEILAREIPSTSDRSTTFPPVPDALLITRRHHLADPNEMIASYAAVNSALETNDSFAGFELYISEGRK